MCVYMQILSTEHEHVQCTTATFMHCSEEVDEKINSSVHTAVCKQDEDVKIRLLHWMPANNVAINTHIQLQN